MRVCVSCRQNEARYVVSDGSLPVYCGVCDVLHNEGQGRRLEPGECERGEAEILGFSDEMRAKLRENDHKGAWGEVSIDYLIYALLDEVQELLEELHADAGLLCDFEALKYDFGERRLPMDKKIDREKIRREAADVGNFAMMLWDRHRG